MNADGPCLSQNVLAPRVLRKIREEISSRSQPQEDKVILLLAVLSGASLLRRRKAQRGRFARYFAEVCAEVFRKSDPIAHSLQADIPLQSMHCAWYSRSSVAVLGAAAAIQQALRPSIPSKRKAVYVALAPDEESVVRLLEFAAPDQIVFDRSLWPELSIHPAELDEYDKAIDSYSESLYDSACQFTLSDGCKRVDIPSSSSNPHSQRKQLVSAR